jgi:hypothetical protein
MVYASGLACSVGVVNGFKINPTLQLNTLWVNTHLRGLLN